MQTKTVIRAIDYLPEQQDDPIDAQELVGTSQSDGLLIGLFGATPDYSNPKFEKLWQEVMDADDQETIAYCLEKNVDVLDDNKVPVSGWRDVAVMLKAIDAGILTLSK